MKSPNATISADQLPAVIGHPSEEQDEAICKITLICVGGTDNVLSMACCYTFDAQLDGADP